MSQYIATLSRWENAYNEHVRCVQRVEGREASRTQAFENVALVESVLFVIGTTVEIPTSLDDELDTLFRVQREDIEQNLPQFDLADCPPDPGPAPTIPSDIGVTVVELPDQIVTSSTLIITGD